MTEYNKEQIKEYQKDIDFRNFYLIFHDQLWTRPPAPGDERSINHREYSACKQNVLKYCQELDPVHMLFIPIRIALYNLRDSSFIPSLKK
jgi:hypothetical protein